MTLAEWQARQAWWKWFWLLAMHVGVIVLGVIGFAVLLLWGHYR